VNNKIESLNNIAAVNLDEPCRDDLKRLSDENKRLVQEIKTLKKICDHEPIQLHYIDGSPSQNFRCKHCSAVLRATWSAKNE
jgi:hypothetical protein